MGFDPRAINRDCGLRAELLLHVGRPVNARAEAIIREAIICNLVIYGRTARDFCPLFLFFLSRCKRVIAESHVWNLILPMFLPRHVTLGISLEKIAFPQNEGNHHGFLSSFQIHIRLFFLVSPRRAAPLSPSLSLFHYVRIHVRGETTPEYGALVLRNGPASSDLAGK